LRNHVDDRPKFRFGFSHFGQGFGQRRLRTIPLDGDELAKRRGAARRHGWPNWQRSNQLLVVLGDPPSRGWPKMLATGIRQKDAGDEIRIERVNPVTECAEDVLKRSAVDDQLERSLVNRGERIANAWRSER
jgi:hypothetical protein